MIPFGGHILPFLKPKQASNTGLIIKTRAPDESSESEEPNDSAAAIEACAQSLIDAVHAKNAQAAAQAIKDAFEILDSMPHEEADHSQETE